MIVKCLTILALCYTHYAWPQKANVIPDSLQDKSFDYIFSGMQKAAKDEKRRSLYIQAFLIKAKSEKNWKEISEGYKNYVHYAPETLRLSYADSMISSANHTRDNAVIGSAYLSKGIAFYEQKNLRAALDNYLVANTYISKTTDAYLIHKTKYNIAQLKLLLGYYGEAIILFKECVDFLKAEDTRGYLNSLHSLGLCYNKAGNYGLCSEINVRGMKESIALGHPRMKPYFLLSEGVNNCNMRNYALAITKIKKALPDIRQDDFGNSSVGYFHIGKSYWMLGKEDIAIQYFKKVDNAFTNNNYIRPDLREAYELMITYYKAKGNVKAQLHYIEMLLKVDKFLYTTFWHIQGKIVKEYDTKELQLEKNKIERTLAKRKYNEIIFICIILLLCAFTTILLVRHRKAQKSFRKKYEILLQKLEASKQPKVKEEENLDINGDAVTKILRQLEKFEASKRFLEKDLNQSKLAVLFGTNTTYLSKIIFHHRSKKFPEYINDLKIDNIAQRIKEEKILRKYNHKALAEEAGFTTTPRFVTAFIARTGITPTFFIEELIKDETTVKA
jgi:AraC-like DNA-binding protein